MSPQTVPESLLVEVFHRHPCLLRLVITHLSSQPTVTLIADRECPRERLAEAVRDLKAAFLQEYTRILQTRTAFRTSFDSLVWFIDPGKDRLILERRDVLREEPGHEISWKVLEAQAIREENDQSRIRQSMALMTTVTAVAGIMGHVLAARSPLLSILLYVVAYITGGYHATINAIRALGRLSLEVDFLMVVAALGAAYLGHPDEGIILLFLFSLSSTLEVFAMDRSRRAIRSLMKERPQEATLVLEGREVEVPVELLQKGDRVMLRPGSQIPTDGTVVEGEGHVDESTLTGESMPVHKTPGDRVFAGSLLQDGALIYEVTRGVATSTLSRTLELIQSARERKARSQHLADVIGEKYTYTVVVGAVLVYLFFRYAQMVPHSESFYRAMVFLVVASPCAVVLSTPAALLSAIAHGARKGILFKGGAYVEELGQTKVLAFDKTGTLTRGVLHVRQILPLNGTREEEVLRLAAALESRSEHPFGQAIVQEARARQLAFPGPQRFRYEIGRGVSGEVEGIPVRVGSPPPDLMQRPEVQPLLNEGLTMVAVWKEAQPIGLIVMEDQPRPEAPAILRRLKQLGIREIHMLTGDRTLVAQRVAQELGVDVVHAELHPEDKVRVVRKLQDVHRHVAMVGDGVNDAPVLATANVGIAIGGASTEVALETADVVLMKEGLEYLPYAIALSRKARKVVLQNFVLALSVIALMVTLNFFVHIPLTLGVLSHEGSTVLVILNGLRLLVPLHQKA